MSLESRLAKLEEQAAPGGVCPGCGWKPDSFRTVYVGHSRRTEPGEPGPPEQELPDQPDRPLCPLCGGFMPPIVFVELPTS